MLCHFPSGILQKSAATKSSDIFLPMIPGADCALFTWICGESLIQHWKIETWEIHYCIIVTDTPAIFEFRQDGESVVLLLSLNGRFKVQDFITGMHELEVSDGLLLPVPNVQGYITCLPEKPSSRLLIVTRKKDNEIDQVKEDAKQFRISTAMFELIDKILYANYSEVRPYHQDQLFSLLNLTKQLLLNLFTQPHFTTETILALHETKTYIDQHLDKEFRLHELARRARMNARKLNLGFKNLFGVTLFVYLREQRLQAAHDRILSTRSPLKLIARSAGYKSYSNFSAAFLVRFGYGPAHLRKQ